MNDRSILEHNNTVDVIAYKIMEALESGLLTPMPAVYFVNLPEDGSYPASAPITNDGVPIVVERSIVGVWFKETADAKVA